MRIVLLCGGAGKRLWPLSNEIRSKLFLRLLSAPDGHKESMLGRVYRQLTLTGLDSSALLLAHRSQVNLAFRHTEGRLPVLGEPAKRGTFTAAALANSLIFTPEAQGWMKFSALPQRTCLQERISSIA